jgi:adenine-specific DNA-methyltransferase
LAFSRSVASKLRDDVDTPTLRLRLCQKLLGATRLDHDGLEALRERLAQLTVDEQHYWVGTFYTLLMPGAERQQKAAYFTPPNLSRSILELAKQQGFDPLKHSVMDPAAGGAAFLSTIAAEMRVAGVTPTRALTRLNGMEIDSGLARLSESLIGHRLGKSVAQGSIVTCRDSLSLRECDQYDLVVANPPYGRLFLSSIIGNRWKPVCHPGHLNKYGLFTELSFRLVKPGGLVALVLPASFIGGPLYDKLRTFIRRKGQVSLLGMVDSRQDVFVDVAQDVAVVIARAGEAHDYKKVVTYGAFKSIGAFKPSSAARLPETVGAAWSASTATSGLVQGGATLADYGATVRSGYFVWNREKDRMVKAKRGKLTFPLIWAKNIQPGNLCEPAAKKRRGTDYVTFPEDGPGIVRKQAIVIQRTTNSLQPRRLVAARIAPKVLTDHGGFVTENHTIVITAPTVAQLNQILLLLNSAEVDARYRQKSGTASISVKLLRELDLPTPAALTKAQKSFPTKAVEEAYRLSLALPEKKTA